MSITKLQKIKNELNTYFLLYFYFCTFEIILKLKKNNTFNNPIQNKLSLLKIVIKTYQISMLFLNMYYNNIKNVIKYFKY